MKEESTLGLMGGCESSPGYYDGEEPFEHGRSMALEGFTTKELVEELCKREGVDIYTIPEGSSHEYYFDGAVRILRVKE